MNGMNFKTFISKLLDTLSDEEIKTLATLMDSHSDDFKRRSLLKGDLTNADKGVSLCTIQLDAETFRTGYLIFNNTYCVLLGYVSNSPVITEYKIKNNTYEVVKEHLTTDYLRHEVQIRAVSVGELGDLVEIKEVENLPAEGEEDTIYLSGSNVVDPVEGPVEVPHPTVSDAGKAIVVDEDGEYALGAAGLSENQVKGLIQADKDVLRQIKYTETENAIVIILPKHIMPLSFNDENDTAYYLDFSNDAVLNQSGNIIRNSSIDYGDSFISILLPLPAYSGTKINGIDYILTDNFGSYFQNTYYLYYPITSGGTKLYKHDIVFESGNELTIISNRSNKYASYDAIFTDFVGAYPTMLYEDNGGERVRALSLEYDTSHIRVYYYSITANQLSYVDDTSSFTDTVTEL